MGKIKVKVFKTFGDTAEDIKKTLIEAIQIIVKCKLNPAIQKNLSDSFISCIRKLNGGMVYYEQWDEEKFKRRRAPQVQGSSNPSKEADKSV